EDEAGGREGVRGDDVGSGVDVIGVNVDEHVEVRQRGGTAPRDGVEPHAAAAKLGAGAAVDQQARARACGGRIEIGRVHSGRRCGPDGCPARSIATNDATSRISSGVSAPRKAGMSLRPSSTIRATSAALATVVSAGPPPRPPSPVSPSHEPHAVASPRRPFRTFAGPCAAVDVVSTASSGSAGPSVPSRPKSHTLSPRVEPAKRFPAEYATTYWRPSCSNTVAGAFMPAPVWNSQSFVPSLESSAVRRPSLRPTNTSPPPVVTEPL